MYAINQVFSAETTALSNRFRIGASIGAWAATALKVANLNPLAAGVAAEVFTKTSALTRNIIKVPELQSVNVAINILAAAATYTAVASLTFKAQLICYLGCVVTDLALKTGAARRAFA